MSLKSKLSLVFMLEETSVKEEERKEETFPPSNSLTEKMNLSEGLPHTRPN